jgi:Uncharacterized protein conserved in bacteria
MNNKLARLYFALGTVLVVGLSSCGPENGSSSHGLSSSMNGDGSSSLLSSADQAIYADEMQKSFNFFYRNVSSDVLSPAYGLVADRARVSYASTASTGFALAGLPIGVENGFVTHDDAEERALITLKNIEALTNFHGFYWHFINMNDGTNNNNSEVSVIDTAIMVIGGLVAGEYFGGKAQTYAQKIYDRIDWKWYTGIHNGKSQFRMSYSSGTASFAGYWDYYAEQLMLYVLGAGATNPDYRTGLSEYRGFTRAKGAYAGDNFIYSWFGSIFTYQYTHAFIDFRGIEDGDGVNWWKNSVDASLAAYDWCQNYKSSIATYSEGAWGLTACDTRNGYSGWLGNYPRGWNSSEGGAAYKAIEGTIAPCGALGSMPFTPENSLKALRNYAQKDDLYGLYGFYDSYDLVNSWTATSYIGIDKGITLLMMDNYLNGTVWRLSKQIQCLQDGLTRLEFKESEHA